MSEITDDYMQEMPGKSKAYVREQAGLDARVVLHGPLDFLWGGVEDADAGPVAVVGGGADDRQLASALSSKFRRPCSQTVAWALGSLAFSVLRSRMAV